MCALPQSHGGSRPKQGTRVDIADHLPKDVETLTLVARVRQLPMVGQSVADVVCGLVQFLLDVVPFDAAVALVESSRGPHLYLVPDALGNLLPATERRMVGRFLDGVAADDIARTELPAIDNSPAHEQRHVPRSEYLCALGETDGRFGALGLFSVGRARFTPAVQQQLGVLESEFRDLFRFLRDRANLETQADQVREGLEQQIAERTRRLVHQERMASIGLLVAGMAHEVNNPTAFIRGNAQTLQHVWPTVEAALNGEAVDDKRLALVREETPKMLETIIAGTTRIAAIVKGLRAYSRQDGGERGPVELGEVVYSAITLTRGVLKRGIDYRVEWPATLATVEANPQQLEQVLINLIVNAAHAMEESETKSLTILAEQTAPDMVTISVEDTGCGIRPDDMESIFQPFFTTKDVDQGTGLGLSICQGIVEDHGGTITVESVLGYGTTFRIQLPCEPASPAETAGEDGQPAALSGELVAPREGLGVLVIDNDPPVLRVAQNGLARAHYRVWTANTAEDALRVHEEHAEDIHLVLTDIVLPQVNGVEVFKTLHAQRPELPVVLMTGYCSADYLAGLRAQGVSGFLEKPFDEEKLLSTVREAFEAGAPVASGKAADRG